MQYEVEINGRARRVVVSGVGDQFDVTIDGRSFLVDRSLVDARTLSLLVRLKPDTTVAIREPDTTGATRGRDSTGVAPGPGMRPVGADECRTYEITVVPDVAPGRLAVRVGDATFLAGLNGRRRFGTRDTGARSGAGPQRIVSPMPGKIVRVLVRSGDAVRTRQPVVVVEAMKMENELRAGGNGIVAEIHAQEGQAVDAGALLVVIQ